MRGSLIIFCALVFVHCGWSQDSPVSKRGTITVRKPDKPRATIEDNKLRDDKTRLLFASFLSIEGEGALTPAYLKAGRGVLAKTINSEGGPKYEVVSFDLYIDVGGGIFIELSSTSNRLTPDMIKNLKKVKSGQYIIFKNVKVKSPETPPELIQGITIRVL